MFFIKDFGVTKKFGVLENGSKIFHYSRPNMPVSTAVVFDAGSRHDPVGKEGLAHFSEHILFKSTKKFKDETETGLFLESIGGAMNAFTSVDFLGVTADVGMSSDYPKVVDFIHELTRNSLFEKLKIDVERGTIIGEIADYESNPALYIHDLTQQLLFQGSYAARSIAGSKETVESIIREDLFNFYSSRIAKSNMSVVVAGDMPFEDITSLYNGSFADEKFPKLESNKPQLALERGNPIMIKTYKDSEQVFIGFSYRTCPYNNKDTDSLELIKTIIGDGFSSSLFRKLRTENGLVYSLRVNSDGSYDRGYFSVLTSTSKNRVQKVLDVLTNEFIRLEKGEISEEELRLAKDKIIKSKIREMQDSGSWVGFHLSEVIFSPNNPRDLADLLNDVEKVSLNNVKEVSKKYFSNDKWYLSLCGDMSEKDFSVNY